MGLGIVVGYAEDDELNELRTLSDALAEEGVTWSEPATTDESFSAGFPYSWLHHLRRVLALVDRDLPVTPSTRRIRWRRTGRLSRRCPRCSLRICSATPTTTASMCRSTSTNRSSSHRSPAGWSARPRAC
ncbi:hypothetical protein ACFQX7_39850 [Luedemannella flava]